MLHRTVRGRLAYTSRQPAHMNQVRGDERFTFTHHSDGKITLAGCSEIDELGHPMDCHVHLSVGDQFTGSGWFHFGKNNSQCGSFDPVTGRLSQRVELTKPIVDFGMHPVIADADVWVTTDADASMVQGGVGGSMLTWYESIELKR